MQVFCSVGHIISPIHFCCFTYFIIPYHLEAPSISLKLTRRELILPGKQLSSSIVLLSLHGNKLQLNEEALTLLRTIKKPVAVLAICGPYRTGKSYFLSCLLGIPNAFQVGHTTETCTRGVWMGTTVLECEEFVLLLLDTEGTDTVRENTGINNLLVITTLLSSCLIYNSVGVPRNTDLQKMRYVFVCSITVSQMFVRPCHCMCIT